MPNHVTTLITATPEVIHAITRESTAEERAAGNPKRVFDFEMWVPSPPNKETGNCSGQHALGVVCWYEWNATHWGTKWNAYSQSITALSGDRAQLRFDTAWSHPEPIMNAVFERFPHERFEVKYADEDLGANLGHYIVDHDHMTAFLVGPDGGEEALDFAAQVKYGKSYAELSAEWEDA